MVAIDWSGIYKKYKGKWVALKDDEITVVGFGETATAALNMARKNGYEHPILAKMPKRLITYVGSFQ